MATQDELERRVEELEQEVSRLRGGRRRGVRHRSSAAIGDLPLVSIAVGPDPAKGEMRGHARGVIAVGDIATGLVAIGGLAAGGICIGGLSVGVASFGGVALGLLLALGGLAVGGTAAGGAAVGRVAIGGAAVGEYACGGGGVGAHVVDATHADPEAIAFFREHGLGGLCPPQNVRR
jgi:hypothetical protein